MNILLVSYAYPPISSPGAIRIYNFAKDLASLGHTVTVLTSSNGYSSMIGSDTFSNSDVALIRTRDLISKKALSGHGQGTSKKKFGLLGLIAKVIYPDRDITWLPTALTNAQLKVMDFDVVLGSYPYATNLIVAAKLAKRHKAKLVLDMRDLWTDEYDGKENKSLKMILNRILEKSLFKAADGIINVSDVNTVFTKSKEYVRTKNLVTIRNGFDYDLINAVRTNSIEKRADKFTVAYAGSFYGGERDPRDLFKAISHLESTGIISESNFTFDIYGPEENIIKSWVLEYNISHLVCFKGMLSQSVLFDVLFNSNVLLTITRTAFISAGEMTTKVFEYIGLGNNILCLCKPEYEIEKVLNKVNSAHIVNFGDIDGIVEFLTREISNNKDGCIFREPLTKDFSRKQAAEELACFLTKL